MTTIVVLADPPVAGRAVPELSPEPLTAAEAADLATAMLGDVCETVQHGEGDLLVNYRPAEQLPADDLPPDFDAEAALRDRLDETLADPDAVRYEPQVGETHAGRVGNALTHLLETEDVGSVGVVDPRTPLLRRDHVGNAMMQLRSNEVVLAPAPDGRVALACFTEPIDFADAFATPAVGTLTERGVQAAHDVAFLPTLPVVERPADLASVVALLRARSEADDLVPPRTAGFVETHDLRVGSDGTLVRGTDRS